MRPLLLLALLSLVGAGGGRDFYKILGVRRNADDRTIAKAYRKGAKEWHPDKVARDASEAEKKRAADKFTDLATAYETLSDPEKRALYDEQGEEGLNPGAAGSGPQGFGGGGPGGPGGGFGGPGGPPFGFGGGGGGGSPFGGFGSFFGGQGQSGGGGPPFGGGGGFGRGGGPPPPAPDPYGEGAKDVLRLTRSTFKKAASKEDRGRRIILLQFYSRTDSVTGKLAPALAKMATSLKGVITVAAVDCTTESAVCEAYGIAHHPTFKILSAKGAEDYNGPLTAKGIRDAVVAIIESRVGILPNTASALASFARKCVVSTGRQGKRSAGGCVVLFLESEKDSGEVPPVLSALSTDPRFDSAAPSSPEGPGFVFALVRGTTGKGGAAETAAAALGISTFPSVALLCGSTLADFQAGALTPSSIRARAGPADVKGRAVYAGGETSHAGLSKWLKDLQAAEKKLISSASA